MKRDLRFDVYTLDFSTFTTLNQVATHCFNVYKNVNSPDFLSDYGDYLYELPKDLHTNIFNFKRSGLDCLKVVGCAIDEENFKKLQNTGIFQKIPIPVTYSLFTFSSAPV